MSMALALWRLLDLRERRRAIGMLALGLLMALSAFVGIASLAPFLLVLADPAALKRFSSLALLREWLGPATDREFALLLGLGFIGVFTLTNAINLAGALAMQRFSLRVGDRLHGSLLNEYLCRDYRFHARVGVQYLFDRVVFWVNRITCGVLDSMMLLVTNALALLVLLVSIVLVNPWLAMWAFAWLGAGYALLFSTLRRRLVRIGAEEASLIAARTRLAMDGLSGIKEVLLLGRQAHFVESFSRSCGGISRLMLRTQAFSLSPRRAVEAMTVTGLVGATLYVSATNAPGVWFAQMTFLGFATYRLLPSCQQIFASLVRIRANRRYFDEVVADLDRGSAAALLQVDRQGRPAIVPMESIELERISFRYASGAAPALRDMSLRIPVGSIVGLAGVNGCGKTTVMDVLAGLLAPDSGHVLIDGAVLGEDQRHAWRRSVAYVPQQMYLFEATVAENIAFGSPGPIDRARVGEAAQLARLDRFLDRLSRGLDERIGGGARGLSGGERQRLAIARALYRDAPVLLLDEFTSALDGPAEREILELLQEFRGRRTIVMAAHGAQALRACDFIYEFEEGAVLQRSCPRPAESPAGIRGATPPERVA